MRISLGRYKYIRLTEHMLVTIEQPGPVQMGDLFQKTQRGQQKTVHSLMGQEKELLCKKGP